jgi:hypothetical protein
METDDFTAVMNYTEMEAKVGDLGSCLIAEYDWS